MQKGEKSYPAELHSEIVKEVDRLAKEKEEHARLIAEEAAKRKEKAQSIITDTDAFVKPKEPKGIPIKKKKAEVKEEDGDEDEEGEEEEEEEEKKSRKKDSAAKDDDKVDKTEDPWGLLSKDVKRDHTNLTCPPFEIFEWGRVVVDEFTYIKNGEHCLLMNMCANAR